MITQAMTVQLVDKIRLKSEIRGEENLLMRVYSDVSICCDNGCNGHCGPKVSQRLDCFSIPRGCYSSRPDKVWDIEYDRRLI